MNKNKDFTYKTLEDYESIVGFEVNESFKIGWAMARMTNNLLDEIAKKMEAKSWTSQ